MSIVETSLGWYVDETYLCETYGTDALLGTLNSRPYYKGYPIPSIVLLSNLPDKYNAPVLISTDPTATTYYCQYGRQDYRDVYNINGHTWYVSYNGYGFYNATNWDVANYPLTGPNFDYPPTQAQIESILERAQVSFSPPRSQILLQYNHSPKNALNKTIDTIITLQGYLRDETSLIDPVLRAECSLDSAVMCNYMTIPFFNRSYFIKNITSVRTNLIEISAHVDVLYSFADEIRANTAIIRRQERDWNLYLNDGSFKIYQNPTVLTKAFPSGFTTQEFVLAVAGSM